MADFIIVAVVLAVIGAAVAYIIKEKKRGTRCIGCPAAGACAHSASAGCSGCGSQAKGKNEGTGHCHADAV